MPAHSLHPAPRPTTARPGNLTYQLRPPAAGTGRAEAPPARRHAATAATRETARPPGRVAYSRRRTGRAPRRSPLVINGASRARARVSQRQRRARAL
jgi:hypothetical protein